MTISDKLFFLQAIIFMIIGYIVGRILEWEFKILDKIDKPVSQKQKEKKR